MNNAETTQPLSEESRKIIDRFRREYERAQTNSIEIGNLTEDLLKPQSSEGFVRMLQEVMSLEDIAPAGLAEAILPEKLLQLKLDQIRDERMIKVYYQPESRIQPAIAPFTYYGHQLEEDEIAQGGHLIDLIREDSEDGRTIGGYTTSKSYIHRLYPEAFQACSFVPEYENPTELETNSTDRERLQEQYTEVFYKLRNAITEAATRVLH